MRIAVITPFAPPTPRGNAVSVGRLVESLGRSGHEVLLISLERGVDESDLLRAVAAFTPDLLLAIHAYRCGPLAARLAERLRLPLVVSARGTDVDEYLEQRETRGDVVGALEAASGVTVLNRAHAVAIEAAVPSLAGRIALIPHAVEPPSIPPEAPDERLEAPLFLLVAGIRPIKRPGYALEPLTRLNEERRREGLAPVRFAVVGPVLDDVSWNRLRERLDRRAWARFLGPIPHEEMGRQYAAASVVLNTSEREGLPNALLEAMALEKAVLASRIPGNEAIVENERTGLLFADEPAFLEAAKRLAS